MLLPELAAQVEEAEQAHTANVLAVSTLHFHTDRREPKPILARSWKLAESKHKCQYARPAVIELGEQRTGGPGVRPAGAASLRVRSTLGPARVLSLHDAARRLPVLWRSGRQVPSRHGLCLDEYECSHRAIS